jgi:putative DNA primase/helicase
MRWGKNNRYWAVETGEGYTFGDYATGFKSSVFPKDESSLSYLERIQRIQAIKEAQAKAGQQRLREQEDKAIEVFNLWQNFPKATPEHPYLRRKQVLPYGLKQSGDKLVIPLKDTNGKIWSLQYIYPDGMKQFHPGGRIKGSFYTIGDIQDKVILCEGYATGASIYQATELPVVVAFNVGNLEAVLLALRKKNPKLKIIIGADNDYKENAQTIVGHDVAMRLGGQYNNIKVIVPQMKEKCKCDFNDVAVAYGLDNLTKYFKEV